MTLTSFPAMFRSLHFGVWAIQAGAGVSSLAEATTARQSWRINPMKVASQAASARYTK
jgi:hypothetical protein